MLFLKKDIEKIIKNNITKAVLPTIISIMVLFSACKNNREEEKSQNKDKYEQIDSLQIEKTRNEGIYYLDSTNEDAKALKNFQKLETFYSDNFTPEDPTNELRSATRFIGKVFDKQEKKEEALVYYKKALESAKKCNNLRGMITMYTLIGEIYRSLGQDSIVLETFLKGREIAENIKSPTTKEIAIHVGLGTDIARWYLNKENNIPIAKTYRDRCIELNNKINSKGNNIVIHYDLGDLEGKQGNNEKALMYYEKGIALAKEINDKFRLEKGYDKIKNRYQENNNSTKAREYRDLEDSLKNARINEENMKQINELNIEYETEKKEATIKEQSNKIELQSAKETRNKIIIYSLFAVLSLTGLYIYNIFKKNRKITRQSQEITKKNKDIEDSITYALRIQNAILPSQEMIDEIIPESFILFKPKDIVSGDFYFVGKTKEGKHVFAVIDCTGHGVPGAFVSILANEMMIDALQNGLEKPSDMLDFISNEIRKRLNPNGKEEIKDGMTISLCAYDPTTQILESASESNSIFLVRPDKESEEIKADKHQIGSQFTEDFTGYKNHSKKIEPGTMIYLFSDGYADQFGGEKQKKFMKRNLKKLLTDVADVSPKRQRAAITQAYKERRGENEQVDDITVMGVRL